MQLMDARYDTTLHDVCNALVIPFHNRLPDLSVMLLEQVIRNCLQGSSADNASEPAACLVLQNAFQMLQKLMALCQAQLIECKGTTLRNFRSPSLELEIGFPHVCMVRGCYSHVANHHLHRPRFVGHFCGL